MFMETFPNRNLKERYEPIGFVLCLAFYKNILFLSAPFSVRFALSAWGIVFWGFTLFVPWLYCNTILVPYLCRYCALLALYTCRPHVQFGERIRIQRVWWNITKKQTLVSEFNLTLGCLPGLPKVISNRILILQNKEVNNHILRSTRHYWVDQCVVCCQRYRSNAY